MWPSPIPSWAARSAPAPSCPASPSGEKVLLFGDLKNYWVADRQNRTFRRLNELYARTDQVGFLTTQRVDGRLILPESVKVLKMAGTKATDWHHPDHRTGRTARRLMIQTGAGEVPLLLNSTRGG
jgi:hypothetical protein